MSPVVAQSGGSPRRINSVAIGGRPDVGGGSQKLTARRQNWRRDYRDDGWLAHRLGDKSDRLPPVVENWNEIGRYSLTWVA